MAIEWNPRLAVGVELIDSQHRELFDHVNKLVAAMMSNDAQSEVPKLIAFLGDYVVSHFGAEERLMRQHGYPALAAHKQDHDDFVAEFKRQVATLKKEGISPAFTIQLNKIVCDWLLEHVSGDDRKLGAFLKGRQA